MINSETQRKNLWSGIGVTLLAGLLLIWVIPNHGGSGVAFGMHPRRLATLGAWVTLVSAAILSAVALAHLMKHRVPLIVSLDPMALWHQVWPFLYTLCFIGLITFLPLTWLAPFLIGGLLLLLGERRWLVIVLTSTIPAAGLYLLTVYLMRLGVV